MKSILKKEADNGANGRQLVKCKNTIMSIIT